MMGNLCELGGANVTCGFLTPSGQTPRSARDEEADQETGAPSPAESATARQSTTIVDEKNGTYKIQWHSGGPGTFQVYCKIDGLHVLNSPFRLVLAGSPPSGSAAASAGVPSPQGGQTSTRKRGGAKGESKGDSANKASGKGGDQAPSSKLDHAKTADSFKDVVGATPVS